MVWCWCFVLSKSWIDAHSLFPLSTRNSINEDIEVWDHETAMEFLRARSVLSRRKVAELVENKELRGMKRILTVKVENNEEKGVVVKKQWLARVGGSNAVDKAFQSLIAMRAEGEISCDCRCPQWL